MKILLVSAFEPTPVDRSRPWRFMNIAEAALSKGHEITFYTSTFNHYKKHQRFEKDTTVKINDFYTIKFVYSKGYTRNISLARLAAHYDFAIKLNQLIVKEDKFDIIFISFPPVSAADKMVTYAHENKIPVIVDIIDPWPDVFLRKIPTHFHFLKGALFFPFYFRLKRILRLCNSVVAISNEYINWARSYGDLTTAHCFYPAIDLKGVRRELEEIKARKVHSRTYSLRLLYAGALASSYDLETILEAAAYFDKNRKGEVIFAIAGNGPKQTIVEMYAKKYSNIIYLGWLNEAQLYEQQFLADLGLIQHVRGATQSVTYKFFDYLGAGLPILNSLRSEMWSLIEDNNLGLNNSPGNVTELVKNILYFLNNPSKKNEFSENAVDFTSRFGDKDIVYGKLVELFEYQVSGHLR